MIPIKLSIKGLYSYRETQVVDFTKLTEASIFGIFGKVGSGKSSILEAITFALYGDTERMNKSGDDRNYNMMNLRSDELLIDFECRAGKDNHLYRFTVKGRRNSKKFDDVKTFERKTYQWMPEISDWAPIEVENASEKIIGLSYENFKRTIIIPQGRFQEFIELPLSKRTQMMNEIFQLERFDLAAKVKVLKETNEKQLEHLNGKIAQLGQSTPEQLEAVKDQILALQTLLGLKNQALNDKVADEKAWIG
jgi:exonuclease SbcC